MDAQTCTCLRTHRPQCSFSGSFRYDRSVAPVASRECCMDSRTASLCSKTACGMWTQEVLAFTNIIQLFPVWMGCMADMVAVEHLRVTLELARGLPRSSCGGFTEPNSPWVVIKVASRINSLFQGAVHELASSAVVPTAVSWRGQQFCRENSISPFLQDPTLSSPY